MGNLRMFKHLLLVLLIVALVTCQRDRGGKAKKKMKEAGRDAAVETAKNKAKKVDKEAAREKARENSAKFKDIFAGKNLSKKKLKMKTDHLPTGIHLPTGQKAAPKACTDAAFGESPGMERIRRNSKDKFYVCSFVNFQFRVGEDKRTPAYTAETVDMRFELFKECVDEVNKQNRKYEAGTATSTAGINFFCDMTEEEKEPFFNGLVQPEDGMLG